VRGLEPLALAGTGFLVVLLMGLWRGGGRARRAAVMGGAGAFLAAALGAALLLPLDAAGGYRVLGGEGVVWDPFARFFAAFGFAACILGLALAWLSREIEEEAAAEYAALVCALGFGLALMGASQNLLVVYLALEGVSVVSYVLAGFRRGDRRSGEAALKYVIYGGVASGAMLFGLSLVYGMAGTLELPAIRALVGGGGAAPFGPALLVAFVLLLAGFGYKVAAVPFHMWCPDVYEGAPTPFTALLSVGPKAAGIAVLMRVVFSLFSFPGKEALAGLPWVAILGTLAAATMTLGNLSAIPQGSAKRLLAYSSIAHAGYMLMAVATVSSLGVASVLLYLVVYLFMNVGAFAAVSIVADRAGTDDVGAFNGLGTRSPFLAVCMTIFLFSLTGIPPLAGFIGKFYLFAAVLEAGGFWFQLLAVVGVVNSAISLYYYARIVKAMFLTPPAGEGSPLRLTPAQAAYLVVLALPVVALGVYWQPLMQAARASIETYLRFL
jgi:NADH-quinone oxidoreductase subunit N